MGERLKTADDQKEDGDHKEGEDVKIIEPPEIDEPSRPGNRGGDLFVGKKFLFEAQHLLLAKPEIGTA